MRMFAGLLGVLGWMVLAGGVLAPVAGLIFAGEASASIGTELVAVPPPLQLFIRSVTLSITATGAALLLGIAPAAVLANFGGPSRHGGRRGRAAAAAVWGLALAPLLVPPQVYAYAWGLATAPNRILAGVVAPMSGEHWAGGAIRAGLISAGWLWPVAAMIVAAGWRMTARPVLTLAILDASPTRAFVRAVLPSLRPYLTAAACLVFAITLVEYPIPHLSSGYTRVYATELMLLMDIHAPLGQVIRMAAPVAGLVLGLLAAAAWSLRSVSQWGCGDEETVITNLPARTSNHWVTLAVSAGVWLATAGLPVVIMLRSLRQPGAWGAGLSLFREDWLTSLGVALCAGAAAVLLTVGTVLPALSAGGGRSGRGALARAGRTGAAVSMIGVVVPPTALGLGLIVLFNRGGAPGWLYDTVPIWVLGLAGRYGPVVVLIAWLALRRRASAAVEQAASEGAGALDIVGYILLPAVWPALLAGGLIVVLLSMFEVVTTHLLIPKGMPSIALTLLNHMHYGRDDVVITTSVMTVVAGIVVTQACAWLLVARRD